MNTLIRRLATGAAGIIAGTALIAAVPAPAQAAPNDLVIHNGGSTAFTVCRSASSDTTCGGTTKLLGSGQNTSSAFGWADTDGIMLGWGCSLTRLGPRNIWYAVAGPGSYRFVKTAGNFGATHTYRVTC